MMEYKPFNASIKIMKTIGEAIQKLRLDKELTQEELAIKADVSYTSLVKIERDQVKNPTIKTLKKLADALEVSVDEILNLINEK
jgi:transcriptional regulator with XRE-family HTH domain